MTKQFSNYSDLLTFTRASKGHALRPVSYGDELVTNGTFDSDTSSWSAFRGATLSVENQTLKVTGDGTFAGGSAGQETSVSAGKVYLLSLDIVEIEATAVVRIAIGSGSGNLGVSTSKDIFDQNGGFSEGSYTIPFVATGASAYINLSQQNNTTGSARFDNVSVKEVTFDQPDGSLTLFEHPDNVPRVEWDSAGNRLGLLVEESRTNLVTYSEDLADSSWNKGGSTTVTTNFTESPDKQENGVRIQAPASSGTFVSRSFSATSGIEYTISLWAKDNGGDSFNFGYASTASSGVTDGLTVTATGEWVRYSHTFTAPSTGTYYIAIDNVGNTSAVDVLIFGVQLEAGSFPTSYIKTTGATATRSADHPIEISWDNFGYNERAGTFVVEFDYTDPDNGDSNYLLSGGGSARFFYNNASTSAWSIYDGAGMSVNGVPSDGTPLKISVAMSDAGTTAHLNGTLNSTNASINPQGSISYDALAIGGISSVTTLNGHIKSIKYYPRRLTNAQLQEITT